MLRAKEVAEKLGISLSLVYQLVEEHKLGCYRVGPRRGAIRFKDEDIEVYLDSCRVDAIEVRPPDRKKLKHIRL